MPDPEIQNLVVGSGPAGVAVATALLARGRQVTMIDGGKYLEPQALARQQALVAKDPASLTQTDRNNWQAVQFGGTPGQARRYGSDFAMEPADQTFSDTGGVALRASRATGGLSNLWGAAVLPYRQQDMTGWPIHATDLAPHYRAMAAMMPVSGSEDALSALFPALAGAMAPPVSQSPQGVELLRRLSRSTSGVIVAPARVAVSADCHRCGLCLHGCPWNLIYSARFTLARLRANPNFRYLAAAPVVAFAEQGDGVTVHLTSGETLQADHLFLATGVLETARLMLATRPTLETLTLLDSQQSFLPMLHRWTNRIRPDHPPHTTLPQLFVEIDDPAISPHLIHSQVYSWNDHYLRDLMDTYGRRMPGSSKLWRAVSLRLMVAQSFVHSDHSARITLRLADDGRLIAAASPGQDTERVMRAATRRLARAMVKAGMVPLSFASRMGAPGASFHTGGTMPMSATPTVRQTDILGRPFKSQRVYLADASTFPSIPATTITLSVMANAHRIGSLAPVT